MVTKQNTSSTKSVGKNTKEVKDNKPLYSFTLQLNDAEQESKGNTILEAIEKIKFPATVGTPAVFMFKKDKKELPVVLKVSKARRFFVLLATREMLCDSWERQLNS